ncbi:hypothetical protein PR202_ga19740 [Eleusine coracana subsp. coracana]|nr:hypothetical protein PR202_ga19740 [Eleusine coracana subsp. coracana]
MAEELDEFEVLWPEACSAHAAHGETAAEVQSPPEASVHRFGLVVRSRPVDVPRRPVRSRRRIDDGGEDEEEDGGKPIVPPHLLLSGRRRSEAWTARTPRTPCKRAGDLRQLRDSVLRMTGFIEG